MKRRPERTKEQIKKDIRFIKYGPIYLKKYKKLINSGLTKEALVMLLSSLWSNIGKLTVERYKWTDGGHIKVKVRKFKNIPSFGRFNKYPRKILAGIYGSTLQIARKEGLV